MSKEINGILIGDIIQQCPEEVEHEFSSAYIRKRKKLIRKNSAKSNRVRFAVRFAALAAAIFVIATGWSTQRFVNGFALGRTHHFVQLTPEVRDSAKARIESGVTFRGEEGYLKQMTDTADNDSQLFLYYTNGRERFNVNLYTVELYNQQHAFLFTDPQSYQSFTAGDKSGIFSNRNGLSIAIFLYGGYVFEVISPCSEEFVMKLIEKITV